MELKPGHWYKYPDSLKHNEFRLEILTHQHRVGEGYGLLCVDHTGNSHFELFVPETYTFYRDTLIEDKELKVKMDIERWLDDQT